MDSIVYDKKETYSKSLIDFAAHLCSTLRSLNPLNHWTVGAGSPSIVNVINPFVPSLGNITHIN